MSKYTAEQVDRLAYVIDGNPEKMDGGEYYDEVSDAAEALRDYAAHLRERESANAGVTDETTQIALNAYNKSLFAGSYGPDDGQPICHDYTLAMRAALEAVAPMLASVALCTHDWRMQEGEGKPIDKCVDCGAIRESKSHMMLASAYANQEPYCYTVEQRNGLSQGAMCRTKAECEASPLFDPENEHVIPLYREPRLASARVTDAMCGINAPSWVQKLSDPATYAAGWNACRAAMLAAASKPETEE